MPKYIDADELKNRLDSNISTSPTYTDYNCGYDDCILWVQDVLANMPTADAQEVKCGKWVELVKIRKDGKVRLIHYQCSVCGCFLGTNTANYCPHCGARMDLEDDK